MDASRHYLAEAPAVSSDPPTRAHAPDEWDARYPEIVDLAWRASLRLGLPEQSVADAVQDTLLVVHRRRAEFRGEGRWQTWVYGIVLKVASAHHKKQRGKSKRETYAPEVLELAPEPGPNPFEALAVNEAQRLLLELLRELPEELREVFVLVELEELEFGEAAWALGCRPSTIKSRLRSARRAFNAAVTRTRARLQRNGRETA